MFIGHPGYSIETRAKDQHNHIQVCESEKLAMAEHSILTEKFRQQGPDYKGNDFILTAKRKGMDTPWAHHGNVLSSSWEKGTRARYFLFPPKMILLYTGPWKKGQFLHLTLTVCRWTVKSSCFPFSAFHLPWTHYAVCFCWFLACECNIS